MPITELNHYARRQGPRAPPGTSTRRCSPRDRRADRTSAFRLLAEDGRKHLRAPGDAGAEQDARHVPAEEASQGTNGSGSVDHIAFLRQGSRRCAQAHPEDKVEMHFRSFPDAKLFQDLPRIPTT